MKRMGLGLLFLLAVVATHPDALAGSASPLEIPPNALRDAALLAAVAVDEGRTAELWQRASPVMAQAQSKQSFVSAVARSREGLVRPLQRSWTGISVRDVTSWESNARPGRYGSVEFDTYFAGNVRTKEGVSLRRDEDGQWRFAGYFIQLMP